MFSPATYLKCFIYFSSGSIFLSNMWKQFRLQKAMRANIPALNYKGAVITVTRVLLLFWITTNHNEFGSRSRPSSGDLCHMSCIHRSEQTTSHCHLYSNSFRRLDDPLANNWSSYSSNEIGKITDLVVILNCDTTHASRWKRMQGTRISLCRGMELPPWWTTI